MTRVTDLSGEGLQHVLDVLSGADSVELKLTLLEDRRARVARTLGIDAMDAQIRQVFFFDTPDLALNSAGVVVRARRRQNEMGDTTVKIRPVNPGDLSKELRSNPEFGGGGGRHARRLRVLGVVQGPGRQRRHPGGRRWSGQGAEAVLQAATSLLRGARS